jgi:hypothetical protein
LETSGLPVSGLSPLNFYESYIYKRNKDLLTSLSCVVAVIPIGFVFQFSVPERNLTVAYVWHLTKER